MNNRILYLFVFLMIAHFSCSDRNNYSPEKVLAKEKREEIVNMLVRHMAKLPKGADHNSKWDKVYDNYYNQQAKTYELKYYHISEASNVHYFLITRPAPSIKEKRVAIGGKVRLESGKLGDYYEVLRTWKMENEELEAKASLLFEEMIDGNDLTKYYPQNSTSEYIEFPDKTNYFDKVSLSWKTKQNN